MICIVGAMGIEIKGLVAQLEDTKEGSIGKVSYETGSLYGTPVVVSMSGIGKVNSSVTAAVLIQLFPQIKLVVNLGVAGGVMPNIMQGDIVVAEQSVQHDYDLTPDGLEKGQICGRDSVYFDSDSEAVTVMCKALDNLGYTYYKGVIASGDQFVNSKALAATYYKTYNAYAVDMETAAVAQACEIFSKKFIGMRSMSDNANGEGYEDFMSFVGKAAARSISTLVEFIKLYN